MRALALVCSLWLAGCNLYGRCCKNSDCSGGDTCSLDDDGCPADGHPEGTCLSKCSLDADCAEGYICNVFVLACGCQVIGDGGSEGTCSPGVGH